MQRYRPRAVAFAVCLAALAGFVDSMGFLGMGGFFVSFMSGNSTRLGVGLIAGAAGVVLTALGLIASFVAGVMAGSTTRRLARNGPRAVLLLVAGLLGMAAIGPFGPSSTMAFLAAGMGAENAVFERDSEVSIGVTYMTGTLVRLGQNLTSALFGGPAFGWTRFLFLWLGLVAGTAGGALAFFAIGLPGIWIAALAALVLALMASWAAIDDFRA